MKLVGNLKDQVEKANSKYTGSKVKDKFLTEIDLLWNTKRQRWNQN